ncbi:MBL fold metallo-hydrolase [Candidatus Riflebacteria bacterium]
MNSRDLLFKLDEFLINTTSIGADETYFIFKELKFSFDVGKCPKNVILCENILLTHLHMDHCAGLPYYISTRGLYNLKPGRIFVLKSEAKKIEKLMHTWEEMEQCRYRYELVPIEPYKEYYITKDLLFQAFPVCHRVPCLGYTLYRQVKKLKKEYLGLSSQQIVELKKNNVAIVNVINNPLVSFLGDTNINVFHDAAALDVFKDSKLLILEATFLADGDESLASGRGHLHFNDIKKILPLLNNQKILLTHFSQRYSEYYVMKMLKKTFAKEEWQRIIPLCPKILLQKPDKVQEIPQISCPAEFFTKHKNSES